MPVYVDNMRARYGSMIMCHMVADTEAELDVMADAIGVARRWKQNVRSGVHYDISLSKRALAVRNGAVEITMKQAAAICYCQTRKQPYSSPEEALDIMRAALRTKRVTD